MLSILLVNYNINFLLAKIGINLFQNINTQIINKRYEQNLKMKNSTIKWLKQFNEIEKIYESDTNFLLIKLRCSSSQFAKKLLDQHNIHIKSLSNEFANFCRYSIVSKEGSFVEIFSSDSFNAIFSIH